MESTIIRFKRPEQPYPDPANPGQLLKASLYQKVTGLPVPPEQEPIERLQCELMEALSMELCPYYRGRVAVEKMADWLSKSPQTDLRIAGTQLRMQLRNVRPVGEV